jgi:hypothetical protein
MNNTLYVSAFILIQSIAVAARLPVITSDVPTDFAVYEPFSRTFEPSVGPYSLNEDLSNVMFADRYTLSPDAQQKLVQNGFVAVPTKADKPGEVYTETREAGLPVFIATDALLHTFHIMYDYMLRIAEHERFYMELNDMLGGMKNGLAPLLQYSGDDTLKEAVLRTAAFLEVAHQVLGGAPLFENDSVTAWVARELDSIEAHEGFRQSNTVPGLIEDFSQYVPRGHYTRNERFKKYFKSMMYLGRMNFVLKAMPTMQACILTRLLATATVNGTNVSDLWEDIYRPTVFFVGRSDDLNFREYKEVLDSVLGPGWTEADIGVIKTNIGAILDGLDMLRPPMILSGLCADTDDPKVVTKGFRIMGQRFIPDSYILGQLVYAVVSTDENPRLLPKGLDILAVLGSERAYNHLTGLTYDEHQYFNYTDMLDSLQKQFEQKPKAQWAENLYWNWLYCLVPLLEPAGEGYPFFMNTVAWADKTLTTASGSWAELRHDTILYAKQSYTSMITSIEIPPPIQYIGTQQGYVEPNPEVFARLAALAEFMRRGFSASNLSTILPIDRLELFTGLCVSLRDIAIKQLEGGNITADEYLDKIGGIGYTLESLENFDEYSIPADNSQQGISSDADTSMAIIADVHTDPNTGQVLEVGVGKAMDVYVAAPIEGKIVLCRGAMFSYYEFAHPMNDRLTDESWQGMLAGNTAPDMPEWTQSFVYDSTHTYSFLKPRNAQYITIRVDVENTYTGLNPLPITIVSSQQPSVTVSRPNSNDTLLGVTPSGSQSQFTSEIPVSLLNADSLVLTVSQGPTSYRKLLIRSGSSKAIARPACRQNSQTLLIRGREIRLPSLNGWRVFDCSGKMIARVPGGVDRLQMGGFLSNQILFFQGSNGAEFKYVQAGN